MIDLLSPTWKSVDRHLRGQLERLREQNDNPKLAEHETAALRGRIAAIKDLLSLPAKLAAEAEVGAPSSLY